MTSRNHLPRVFVLIVVLVFLFQGCCKSESPTVDPQPFKAAVAQYLERNNMAMTLKQIKAGPIIEGRTATLAASLQHATIPMASSKAETGCAFSALCSRCISVSFWIPRIWPFDTQTQLLG